MAMSPDSYANSAHTDGHDSSEADATAAQRKRLVTRRIDLIFIDGEEKCDADVRLEMFQK